MASFAIDPPAPKSGSSGWADTTSTLVNFGECELDEVEPGLELVRPLFLAALLVVATSLNVSDRGSHLFPNTSPLAGEVGAQRLLGGSALL